MPVRLIQLILGRFGWDRESLPFVKVLPPGSIPVPRAEDGLCEVRYAGLIEAEESDFVCFEAVQGQRLTIEVVSDGAASIHLFAGDLDDDSSNLLGSWFTEAHQPCRAVQDIFVSGLHTILIENNATSLLRFELRIADRAARSIAPRKGPVNETELSTSAAAGADGLGNGRAKHGNRDGQQGSLIGSRDPAEPPGVFVPREQADGQAHHRDGTGQQSDDDVEPPA